MKTKFSGILTLLLVLVVQLTFAQEKTITGTVTDDLGIPLPGANIIIKGTNTGTQSDFDGNYSIQAQANQTLMYSYVGFETKEIPVGAQTTINVTMTPGAQLDEVVITGYGEQKAKELTTSVTTVTAEQIQNVSTPNIAKSIQGNALGVFGGQASGAPGAAVNILVRGPSSLTSNGPLYVIDGVPISANNLSSGLRAFGGQDTSPLSSINANDIESVTILKDAAAASIYGSRSANGVILITTKKGKKGVFRANVNHYTGYQREIERPEVFTSGQYARFVAATNGDFEDDPAFLEDEGDDYISAVYRPGGGFLTSTDASITGGSDNVTFYSSFGSYEQEGVLLGQDYKRKNGQVTGTFNSSDSKFTATGSASLTNENQSLINSDNNIFAPLTTAILEAPGNMLFNEDGTFNTSDFTFSNPLQNATVVVGETETQRFIGSLSAGYQFYDDLSTNFRVSYSRIDFTERSFFPAEHPSGDPDGSGSLDINLVETLIMNQTFNYNKKFGQLALNALAGYEFQNDQNNSVLLAATGFPNGITYLGAASTPTTASQNLIREKRFGYFARVGLDWAKKYFIEASMRADAYSGFSLEDRIGYFPAISGAYIVSKEDWFGDSETFNFFKLKASYGVTGNSEPLGAFGYLSLGGTANYADLSGTQVVQIANPLLTWEETAQLNVGTELGFFNDRIFITYDYFKKESTDVLLTRPTPNSVTGGGGINDNVAEITNSGHEVSLNAKIIKSDDFNASILVNVATLENEVTALFNDADGEPLPIDAGFATRIDVGQPIGAFFGLQANGLWQEGDAIPQPLLDRGVSPGDVRYVDTNGDGDISDDDRVFIGKGLPGVTGNFRLTMNYKNFDFTANTNFALDYNIYNNTLAFAGASGSRTFNKFASQLDYWTPTNTDTDLPRPRTGALQSYNNQDSSRFIEDGDYFRLKEISLGYTIRDINWFESVRVYVSVDNLLTITDYSGFDPEVSTFGAVNTAYSTDFFTQGLNRTFKIGFNASL